MSVTDNEELVSLLSDFFFLRGGGPAREELLLRVGAITSPDDLIVIDQDTNDPLWYVVPQIAMHRFGQQAFQAFEPRHAACQSFVFVHPAHRHIVGLLKESLREHWAVGEEITLILTLKLINSLYGGYQWHDAYAAGCRYRGDLGLPATIILLPSCSHSAVRELIAYKNAHRAILSEKIVVDRELLDQQMNAVIQAFHCPDVIENARQLLSLGLADLDEIVDDHTHHRCP